MTHETVTQKPNFDVVMRGYERAQVDEHITKLQRELSQLSANLRQERDFARNGSQQLVAERDNALRQLHAAQEELEKLRSTAAETTVSLRPKDAISLFGDRLQTILTTAEQEAAAVKAEAQEAAGRIREKVAREADELLTGARQEAQALRSQARQEADTVVAEARREAETTLTQARQEAGSLLAGARQEAATVTEQANAEAERLTTSARDEATTTLDTIRREASQLRASLATLTQRREQVRRELTQIGAAIESLLADDGTEAAGEPEPAAAAAPDPAQRQETADHTADAPDIPSDGADGADRADGADATVAVATDRR